VTAKKSYNYPRVSDESYQKALTQLRLQVSAIMNNFRCYGLQDDVDGKDGHGGAIDELIKLAEQFSMRVRGKDEPIRVRNTPRRRPTE